MGIGIPLSQLKFKPEHLRDAVEEARKNSMYKENALRYQKVVESYGRAHKGAELIEAYGK